MGASPGQFPLTILCGKGGVGKTTLSLALALRHANQGRSVLVVTSHPLPELAVSVSLSGLKEKYPQAAANLFVIHIESREVLDRTVRHQIPSEFLAEAVLSSRIYHSLVEVAPGLKELAFLGRLQQLAAERSYEAANRRFDLLIWDAPATGHFLQTLGVFRNFDLYLSGPFAVLAKQLTQFFSDASHLALIPVTTLEGMAVEETLELYQKLVHDINLQPFRVICNMTSPLLDSADSEWENLSHQVRQEQKQVRDLQFILDRHAIERSLFHQLRATVKAPIHRVERRPYRRTDLELLVDLSQGLEELSECLGR